MGKLIESIGKLTLPYIISTAEIARFAWLVITGIFKRNTYTSAGRMVLTSQLYFTSVEVLPLLMAIALFDGIVLLGVGFQYIKGLGFADTLLKILMVFVVCEVSPLTTVILIALRSSAAMNTEIAVMKVSGELHALEVFRISPLLYLFIPRIINGMISLTLLSCLFVLTVLASGLIFSKILFGIDLDFNINLLLNYLELSDIVILLVKSVTFGFFITLIPINYGLKATRELTSIPVSVLKGMVQVFIAIAIIEVLTLIPRIPGFI